VLALITAVLLIVCGLLAARRLVPLRLRRRLDRLRPAQATLGVALLIVGVCDLLWLEVPKVVRHARVGYALTVYASVASAILLGVIRGVPHIAGWIAGDSPAEEKMMEMQRALGDHEAAIGVVAAVAGTLLLGFELGLLGRT